MADITLLRARPWLTGLLLGLVLYLSGNAVASGVTFVALLLFPVGVVLAIWGEGWIRPVGQSLAGAGGVVLLLAAVAEVLEPLFGTVL